MANWIRKRVRRVERATFRAFDFCANVCFFLGLRHKLGEAINKARNTLPESSRR